jgi:hypothetical protein
MFAHFRTRSAAMAWREMALLRRRLAGLAALLLLAGCTMAPPAPLSGPDPADSTVRVAPAGYRSAFGGYVSQRPAEPQPWLQQNEGVAPERKP